MGDEKAPDPQSDGRDERISLEGLDPEEALKALLAVDPDVPPVDDAERPKADERDERDSARQRPRPRQRRRD